MNDKSSEGLSSVKMAALARVVMLSQYLVLFCSSWLSRLTLVEGVCFVETSFFNENGYTSSEVFFQRKWKVPGLVLVYVFLSTNLTEKILVHFVHTWLSFRFRFRWTVWNGLTLVSQSTKVRARTDSSKKGILCFLFMRDYHETFYGKIPLQHFPLQKYSHVELQLAL